MQTYPATTTPAEGDLVAWTVLVISGLLETVWAVALAESDGFRHTGPTVLFGVALALSMTGLAVALRTVPLGTGYAVWVGIGAVGTAVWGIAVQGDPASLLRICRLVAIVAGVVGLRLAQ